MLEREVVPSFYERDAQGIPRRWVSRMRASMATLTPTYSANRALRDYTRGYYIPLAGAITKRVDPTRARRISEWLAHVKQHWPSLRFGDIRVATGRGEHRFEVSAYLDEIDPDSVRVELYADGREPTTMHREAPLVGARGFLYVASVPDSRPASDFTPRLVPHHPDLGAAARAAGDRVGALNPAPERRSCVGSARRTQHRAFSTRTRFSLRPGTCEGCSRRCAC